MEPCRWKERPDPKKSFIGQHSCEEHEGVLKGTVVWERSSELRTTSIIKVFLGFGHSHKEGRDCKATAGGEVEAAGGCGLICEREGQPEGL